MVKTCWAFWAAVRRSDTIVGTTKTRPAETNPHSAAPVNQPACETSTCSPMRRLAINHAMAMPKPAPKRPTIAASAPVSTRVRKELAPRSWRRATSLRRLSPLVRTISIVSKIETIAPGTPRKRNSTLANKASCRTPSSRAARLFATTPSPASFARRLLARPVAST